MYFSSCKVSLDTPQAHDGSDYYSLWSKAADQQPSQIEPSDAGSSIVEVRCAFDAMDPGGLVDFATNVLVGQVGEETNSEGAPLSGSGVRVMPRTQFGLTYRYRALGVPLHVFQHLDGGWYDEEEGREVHVEGDSLLEPAKKYVFPTSYNPEEEWYVVVAQPSGDVLVEGEARRRDVQERFEQAAEEQVPPDPAP